MVGCGMKEVAEVDAKNAQYSHLFKVCLCGSSTVGKTAAMLRFTHNSFTEEYLATIGVDFAVKTVQIDGGDLVKLQIWDTAGQERFRTITNSYYRGAHGIILFFDLTDRESFENLSNWVNEVRRYSTDDVSIVLAGAKSDLVESRAVTSEEFRTFAEEEGLPYIEISAVTGDNVHRLFEMMLEKMVLTKKELRSSGGAMSTMVGPLKKEKFGKKGSSSSDQPDGKGQKSKTCVVL